MALAKLQALHAFITSRDLVMPERFNSWMEDGQLIPANKNLGADQLLVGRLQYEALLSFDNFTKDPALLMALVCAWLVDNDPERDDHKLPAPTIDVDMLDDNRADVEIKITFREDIQLQQSDSGAVPMNGNTWEIAPATVFDVDTAAVGDDQAEPTDLPYTRPPQ